MIFFMTIHDIIKQITPPNAAAMDAATARLATLIKPEGSLGVLESCAVQLAGIFWEMPKSLPNKKILVFAADHGLCAEGIGSAPQSLTHMQTLNFTRGITGVAVLARHAGAEMIIADVGVLEPVVHKDVRSIRVRAGTGNIRLEDAMTRAEAEEALLRGAELAREAAENGASLLGVGEMGIGNTTASTTVLCALTGLDSDSVTGAGGGIGETRLAKKRQTIHDALARANADPADPIGVLAKLGGLEICAMAGAYLGAASAHTPVVVDGYIGCVAALAAARIAPAVLPYLIPSHQSDEPGAKAALAALGVNAPLHMNMRLGEGSGCPLMFGILDAALCAYHEIATFAEAMIDTAYQEEVRK